jgi:hypothetical protein
MARLVAAYGHNPVARLLDVDAALLARWSSTRGRKRCLYNAASRMPSQPMNCRRPNPRNQEVDRHRMAVAPLLPRRLEVKLG